MVHGAAGSTPEGLNKHYWSPEKAGRDFEFSYSLQPLEPLREYITIVGGTDARTAEAQAPTEGGADHFRSSAAFLTAAHAKQTAGPDISNGISIDQMYTQALRRETRVPSLELCIENVGLNESCGFNYSCIYSETISWASATQPVPMIVNPRLAFEKLFGASAPSRAQGSVLDTVKPEAERLKRDVGAGDRARIDAHLDEIRRIE